MLSDLESLEKRVPAAQKKATSGDKEARIAASVLGQALDLLREGKPARLTEPKDEEEARDLRAGAAADRQARALRLQRRGRRAAEGNALFGARVRKGRGRGRQGGDRLGRDRSRSRRHGDRGAARIPRAKWACSETGLARVIRAGYDLLHLITFFTVGPKEARAWTRRKRAPRPRGGGRDPFGLERGFIRAETIAYDDYVALGGETGARDAGKLRQEGKEYVVQDGDVLHFKFNV